MKTLKFILLIDDDEATNFYHKYILEESKVVEKIEVATNGEEAIKLLQNLKENNMPFPDLIFLDINMPIMNGWEFLMEYEKSEMLCQKNIIVMLTTSLNPDDKAKSKLYHSIFDFKNKPMSEDMLLALITEIKEDMNEEYSPIT